MNVSRRGFLGVMLAACAAPAIIRTPGLIMPIKPVETVATTILMAPGAQYVPSAPFLTPDMVTREALRILHDKLNFISVIHKDYDLGNCGMSALLRVRLPAQYAVAA